jgi:hypothetical protein
LEASQVIRRNQIGFLEILALEGGCSGELGKRIGKAVATVQARRMASLADVVEGLARDVRLLDAERFDDDAGSAEKRVACRSA